MEFCGYVIAIGIRQRLGWGGKIQVNYVSTFNLNRYSTLLLLTLS